MNNKEKNYTKNKHSTNEVFAISTIPKAENQFVIEQAPAKRGFGIPPDA